MDRLSPGSSPAMLYFWRVENLQDYCSLIDPLMLWDSTNCDSESNGHVLAGVRVMCAW